MRFDLIINKFKEINQMKYVKGINSKSFNSCGLTFEKLLGKEPDSSFFPDLNQYEIKCTQRFSQYPITLFSLAFDGPELFETNYLLETYGYNDSQFSDHKKLIKQLKYDKMVYVNNCYFELKIDEDNYYIYINIYDKDKQFIEKRGILDFDSISKRINLKLKNMCLIYASKKKTDDGPYFRYYKIECYTFKDFEQFIKLIKSGVIVLTIMLRFSRTQNSFGKNRNKGIVFAIQKDQVSSLFNLEYKFEN